MLVRGSEREREFAVRSALGAGGGAPGAADADREPGARAGRRRRRARRGARWRCRRSSRSAADTIPRLAGLSLDPRLLVFSLVISSVCAVCSASRRRCARRGTQPGDVLRGESRSATGGARARPAAGVAGRVAGRARVRAPRRRRTAARERSPVRARSISAYARPTCSPSSCTCRPRATTRPRGPDFYEDLARRWKRFPVCARPAASPSSPRPVRTISGACEALSGPLAGTTSRNVAAQKRVVSGDYFRAVGFPCSRDARSTRATAPRAAARAREQDRWRRSCFPVSIRSARGSAPGGGRQARSSASWATCRSTPKGTSTTTCTTRTTVRRRSQLGTGAGGRDDERSASRWRPTCAACSRARSAARDVPAGDARRSDRPR